MNEYNTEKYIEQYEHIIKLELLTNEELSQVKKKRAQFEVAIRSANKDPKAFVEYIKYECALMKKFRQNDNQDEKNSRALDRAMSSNVKEIFRVALRKFQDKRKIWSSYVSFAKNKFPSMVSSIYQDMLNFHHSVDDYVEAVVYEMSVKNYNVAIQFLIQGMSKQKESKELVVLYIECTLKQAHEHDDEKFKANTLIQAKKFYTKFLKESSDVKLHVDLLRKIQNFDFSINFQNDVVTHLLQEFTDNPDVWDIVAKRHLDGLFYGDDNVKNPSFDLCLNKMLAIYEKSFEFVSSGDVKRMYSLYIETLLELDAMPKINDMCLKYVRQALGKG
jgi:hypothetical protein